jgi:hypothetical protein
MTYTNGSSRVQRQPGVEISGLRLSRLLRGMSVNGRVSVAAKLASGEYVLVGPLSPTQAARLCNVNVGNVSVRLGHRGIRGPRRSTIDRLVKKFGVSALLEGCDRATAPAIAAE